MPKNASGRVPVPHDAPSFIEEAVVNLHALTTYTEDLTPNEIKFIHQVKRNLAVIHRRLQRGKE
jgi:hypothetical protein